VRAVRLLDANDLDAVLFSQEASPAAGDELRALAARISASTFVYMELPVWVVWADANRQTALSLDRAYISTMHGARMVDAMGRSVGLLRNAAQPGMISAEVINAFLDRYLGQPIKNQ
jgi:hypothetical protein